MAKAPKSFADKAKKEESKKAAQRQVRVIRSIKDPVKGTVRFLDGMVAVPGDADLDAHLLKFVEKAK